MRHCRVENFGQTVPLGKVNNFNVRWFLVVSDQALWSVVIKKSVAAYNLQLQLNTALEISGDVSYTWLISHFHFVNLQHPRSIWAFKFNIKGSFITQKLLGLFFSRFRRERQILNWNTNWKEFDYLAWNLAWILWEKECRYKVHAFNSTHSMSS